MNSSVDNKAVPVPRLELPSWLDDYPAVAEQAERLYHLTLENPKYRPTHAEERVRILLNKFQSLHDSIFYRNVPVKRPFAEAVRTRPIASLKLLCRLTSDPRMRHVWRELYRKKLGSNEFLNPAKRDSLILETITALHDPKNQDNAVKAYLNYAFLLAVARSHLTKQAELAPFSVMASRLRNDAQMLHELGLDRLGNDVQAIAAECKSGGYTPESNVFFPVVSRSSGNQMVRGFVLRLSAICLLGFDKALSGTVATTASVAFSKKINASQVRDIVRAHDPGVSSPADAQINPSLEKQI